MDKMRTYVLIWVLGILAMSASASPRSFVSGSLDEIRSNHRNPFLLVLWSLDCPPCRQELKLLGQILREYPKKLDLVLIAADDSSRAGETEKVLQQYGLQGIENWIFASGNPMRLRYEIDPGWYGELPRSYFFFPDGKKIGVSGALRQEQIRSWLEAVSEPHEGEAVQ